ncbi:MAG TPA: ABC transporter substrate-binding protein [Streptosporangiaceae bacterium]
MSDDLNKLRTEHADGLIGRRELLRRAALIGLSGPALGAFLAACGSSSPSPRPAGGGTAAIGTTVLTPAPKGSVDSINWGLFYEPSGLDWIYDYNYEENTVVANITESLMRLTPQFTIEPALAESFSAPDPLTKVYQIRQGVKFSDGSPMTVDDVVFSLQRHLNPASFWNFAYVNVKSVEKTGAAEVTVRMKRPDEVFHPLMATPAGGVGKASYLKAKGKAYGTPSAGPVGTGPFTFTSWAQGSSIIISKNDSYWDTAHAAKVGKITFSFIPQESTMTTALLSGEIDGAYHTPYSGLGQLRSTSAGKLYLGKSMIFTEIIIAGTTGPLTDHRVRTALLLAIDRTALAKTVYNGAASALRNTVVPLGEWGYGQAEALAAWNKLAPPAVDLTKAKQLVAQAGAAAKAPMTIATRASFQRYINIATIVQAAAKQIGLTVNIKSIDPNTYGNLFFSAKARSGIDMFISENYADIPEPLEILYPAVVPGQFYNYNGYNNPTVTSDLGQAFRQVSDNKRASLVLAAQAVLANDLAALPLANPAVPLFMNKRITGAPASFCYLYYPWARDIGAAAS